MRWTLRVAPQRVPMIRPAVVLKKPPRDTNWSPGARRAVRSSLDANRRLTRRHGFDDPSEDVAFTPTPWVLKDPGGCEPATQQSRSL